MREIFGLKTTFIMSLNNDKSEIEIILILKIDAILLLKNKYFFRKLIIHYNLTIRCDLNFYDLIY